MSSYSTYDAKARFSEILGKVRGGETVTISYRGEDVAEIRPIPREAPSPEAQIARLEERGILQPAAEARGELAPLAERPGALARFLAERE